MCKEFLFIQNIVFMKRFLFFFIYLHVFVRSKITEHKLSKMWWCGLLFVRAILTSPLCCLLRTLRKYRFFSRYDVIVICIYISIGWLLKTITMKIKYNFL